MPSWAPASMVGTDPMAVRTARAWREPPLASGSIWVRRAEMSANSAPTKNPFAASRTTMPAASSPLTAAAPRRWGR